MAARAYKPLLGLLLAWSLVRLRTWLEEKLGRRRLVNFCNKPCLADGVEVLEEALDVGEEDPMRSQRGFHLRIC